jgi:hypothetical protein
VKRCGKLLIKYRNASDINAQNIIDEWANKFDQKFCDGKLLKSRSINLTLRDDLDYLRACPEYANGLTYSYPTQQRWKYMKRGFSCFITHSLSKAENRETLIDTVVHELIHAKIHMDELTDMDDHGPTFLRLCSKAAKHFKIKFHINEHFEKGFKITGNKTHDNAIIKKVNGLLYRKKIQNAINICDILC